jgi:prophage regulatory protein
MGKMLQYDELKEQKGVPFSKRHLLRLEQAGKFPKRIAFSAHSVLWDEAEVDAFLKAKRAARDAPPKQHAIARTRQRALRR